MARKEFSEKVVNELLSECHRRCCICHRFCGVKMEIDHIEQCADGGTNDKKNGIPVCFECHAEIHSYNDKHPRGRKFRPEELRMHRDQWFEICAKKPEVLLSAAWRTDVGPLQALIDELEFNAALSSIEIRTDGNPDVPPHFIDNQFKRCIQEGCIAILKDDLKNAILKAYSEMSVANQQASLALTQQFDSQRLKCAAGVANTARKKSHAYVSAAKNELIRFLKSDEQSDV